ncbi:hypothetical protein PUN28_006634 [Cardiocondyla obscurior]|uniref:Transmembrane protein n=1 Tax=Cardiocondyla obscurior TaxID=286306 RepID=A0AAW2GBH4_9HYME
MQRESLYVRTCTRGTSSFSSSVVKGTVKHDRQVPSPIRCSHHQLRSAGLGLAFIPLKVARSFLFAFFFFSFFFLFFFFYRIFPLRVARTPHGGKVLHGLSLPRHLVCAGPVAVNEIVRFGCTRGVLVRCKVNKSRRDALCRRLRPV